MSIDTAKRGDNQSPSIPKCADKRRRAAQDIVSDCKKRLRDLDRRFVRIAFDGGLISADEAETWLLVIEAGERRKADMKSLLIQEYSAGKLSREAVQELFWLLELEGA